jgi:hypothetical protein
MNARSWRLLRVLPALVVVISLLACSIAMAGAPEAGPTVPQTQAPDPAAPSGADDSTLDVGAEFPSADAPPWGASEEDRPIHATSAWNFYNKMRAAGYTGSHSFIYGNNLAWETDWKRAALGGSENNWVDNVDIMFVHSHGSSGGLWMPWDHTDTWVVPNDCASSWGDKDVEWIGIKTCQTLTDVVGWATCMNGVHLIAGFITDSDSVESGGVWADQLLGWQWLGIWLRSPKTVTQAWFTMCDDTQPANVTARVIAEDWRHFDDKVWNRGGPVYGDIVDWPKYYRDHSCYKPPARQVDVDALSAAAVNTFVVDPRNVTQAYAQGIANSLGLQGDVQCPPSGTECGLVASQGGQTLTLSIPTASGGFTLQNTSQLWTAQNPAAPLTLPTEQAATALAGSFLDSHMTLPGSGNIDKTTAHYVQDTQSEVTRAAAAGPARILQTQGTDVLVAYGRTLATGVQAAGGAMIDVGTVGPGSASKVYYGGASTAFRGASQEQLPIGLLGGSRDVKAGGTTTTKPPEDSWAAFLADRQLAVNSLPLDWDTAVLVGQTFSYYEQSQDVPQQELIPVWVFTADLYKGAELVGDNSTFYVPANSDYYPPNVTIDAPIADSTVVAGRWVDLQATTIGGFGPFAYEWSSSAQGPLATGDQEDTKAMLLGQSDKEGETTPVAITLKVTNQNGQSRTAEVIVNVVGQPQYLPLIMAKK